MLEDLAPNLTGESRADRAILAVLAQRRVERAEPVEQAVAAARLALERGLLTDHGASLRAPAGVALRALIESDEREMALHWIGEGLELAQRRGSRLGQLTARRFLAELALYAGELAVAEADARVVADTWREAHSLAAFCAAAVLSRALVARGRLDQAEETLAALGDGRAYPGFPNAVVALGQGEPDLPEAIFVRRTPPSCAPERTSPIAHGAQVPHWRASCSESALPRVA